MLVQRDDFKLLIATSVLLSGLLLGGGEANAKCNSGPDYCQDDPRIPKALKAKKAKIVSSGFPQKYADLLDKGTKCFAKIDRAPDVISHWIVSADGSKVSRVWEEQNHTNLLKMLNDGEVLRFWIMNARQSLSCDGEPNFDKMADYDAEDEINTTQAIKCTKGSGC